MYTWIYNHICAAISVIISSLTDFIVKKNCINKTHFVYVEKIVDLFV